MLLLALSTVFLWSFDRGYFYSARTHEWNTVENLGGFTAWNPAAWRASTHDRNTVKNLAIAENLSPDHGFRLFLRLRQGLGDAPAYEMYSRFPVGGYALIKLAILPFGNDLSARILAARMLMLLLFSAAALLAFLAIARITSHRWIALAATLLAFSSSYMLYYDDSVSNEFSMDLFAVMLAFHGMVVFVQEGRFRQLLAKTCVALLLGWHVYAFLAPFLVLGLASEAVRAWKGGTAPWPRVRSTAAAVLRSRYMALGVFALLFGAAVLGFNFANEYTSFRGGTAVTELPSVQSMLRRTGLEQNRDSTFEPGWWLRFLRQQFFRVCVASVPFVLTDLGIDLLEWFSFDPFSTSVFSGLPLSVSLLLALMVVVASTTMVFLARRLLARRHSMLLATLALSGFFWALPMRHNTAHPGHEHEAMFYVGVPLVFYALLLLYVHKRRGHRPVVGLAVAALLAFVVSAFRMDHRWRIDAQAAELQQAALAELGTIRETTWGKVVLVLPSVEREWSRQVRHPHHAWSYYLAGSVLTKSIHTKVPRRYYSVGNVLTPFPDMESAARAADFIVTGDRVESDALLTPRNEQVFLYDSAGMDDLVEFYRAVYQRVVSGEPAVRSYFDFYLRGRALVHVREHCVQEDVGHKVFVEVVPEDPKHLPGWRRRYGFEQLYISFQRSGVLFDGNCMVVLPLPDYPVSVIRTGHASQRGPRWEVEIPAIR